MSFAIVKYAGKASARYALAMVESYPEAEAFAASIPLAQWDSDDMDICRADNLGKLSPL